VQLEGVDPMVVLVDFPLADVSEVDLPQVDFSMVGASSQEPFLVDREAVNVLVSRPLSEFFGPKLHSENLSLLRLVLALRGRVGGGVVCVGHKCPLPSSSTNLILRICPFEDLLGYLTLGLILLHGLL
jgi:hypothetical protein